MVWLSSSAKCSKGEATLKTKGERIMADSDEDTPYLHIKHLKTGPKDKAVRRKVQRTREQGSTYNIREGKCQVVTQNWPGVTVLLVSLCINVTFVTYLCFMNKGKTDELLSSSSAAALSTSVCILCASIGLAVNDESIHIPDNIDVIVINNSKMCCLKNTEHLQKLVTLFSAQYPNGGFSSDIQGTAVDRTECGAHLFLDSIALKDDKLVWTDEYGLGSAYVGSGVNMVNGRFGIKQDGCYFVYSFITFKSRETLNENYNAVHTVSRYNSKLKRLGNQLLLMRKQTLAKKSETFSTSYLGAALVLRAGDELLVDASPISAVYAFAPSNFFGLFRLQC